MHNAKRAVNVRAGRPVTEETGSPCGLPHITAQAEKGWSSGAADTKKPLTRKGWRLVSASVNRAARPGHVFFPWQGNDTPNSGWIARGFRRGGVEQYVKTWLKTVERYAARMQAAGVDAAKLLRRISFDDGQGKGKAGDVMFQEEAYQTYPYTNKARTRNPRVSGITRSWRNSLVSRSSIIN